MGERSHERVVGCIGEEKLLDWETMGMGSPLRLILAMALGAAVSVTIPTRLGAQSTSGAAAASSSMASNSGALAAPALSRAVGEAVRSVASEGGGYRVVGAPLETDTPAPQASALVQRVVSLVAGALGPTSRGCESELSLENAMLRTNGFPALVYVRTQIASGEVRVTVDRYPMARNIWDKARGGVPGPSAHGFGRARLDAEVRSFLAPIPLVAQTPRKVPMPAAEVVALACGDWGEDGAIALYMMTRRTILQGRIRQGRIVTLKEKAWNDLSSIAPSPWREPLATMVVGVGGLDVGLTDRAMSVRLDPNFSVVGSYEGMPLSGPSGVACAQRRVGSLAAELSPCMTGESSAPAAPFAFDAYAFERIVDAKGATTDVWAVRNPTDGSVVLRDDRAREHRLLHVGAQLAIADVDLDGEPELLASKNVLNPQLDALVLRTWRANGRVEKRLEVPIVDGIQALTVCPPDGPHRRNMLVATHKELWVL